MIFLNLRTPLILFYYISTIILILSTYEEYCNKKYVKRMTMMLCVLAVCVVLTAASGTALGIRSSSEMDAHISTNENAPTLFHLDHLDQDLDQDLWDVDVSDEQSAPPSAPAADASPSASCATSGATNMDQKDIDDEISTQQLYAFSSVTMSPCPAAVRRGQGKDVCDQSSNHSAITSSNSFLKTGGIAVRSTCPCCEKIIFCMNIDLQFAMWRSSFSYIGRHLFSLSLSFLTISLFSFFCCADTFIESIYYHCRCCHCRYFSLPPQQQEEEEEDEKDDPTKRLQIQKWLMDNTMKNLVTNEPNETEHEQALLLVQTVPFEQRSLSLVLNLHVSTMLSKMTITTSCTLSSPNDVTLKVVRCQNDDSVIALDGSSSSGGGGGNTQILTIDAIIVRYASFWNSF